MLAIVVQTFIAAPAAAVWDALLGRADVVLDALPEPAWPEQGRDDDPPRHLACGWPAAPGTSVEVVVHDVAGGVRLDLRHVNWAESPDAEAMVQGHFAGWLQGMAALGHLIETGEDPRSRVPGERYFISGEIPASADAVFAVLPTMVTAELADRREGRLLRWRVPGGELVAILRPTPRGTHVALAEYGVTDRSASERWPALFESLTLRLK